MTNPARAAREDMDAKEFRRTMSYLSMLNNQQLKILAKAFAYSSPSQIFSTMTDWVPPEDDRPGMLVQASARMLKLTPEDKGFAAVFLAGAKEIGGDGVDEEEIARYLYPEEGVSFWDIIRGGATGIIGASGTGASMALLLRLLAPRLLSTPWGAGLIGGATIAGSLIGPRVASAAGRKAGPRLDPTEK